MSDNVSQIRTCRGCGASIRWIRTEAGKPMPVEANAKTYVTEGGRVVKLYEPHWGNCSQADAFRGQGEG